MLVCRYSIHFTRVLSFLISIYDRGIYLNRLDFPLLFMLVSRCYPLVVYNICIDVSSCNFQACCLSPSSTMHWPSRLWCFSTFTTHSLTTARSTKFSSASTLSSASSSPLSPSYPRYRYSGPIHTNADTFENNLFPVLVFFEINIRTVRGFLEWINGEIPALLCGVDMESRGFSKC